MSGVNVEELTKGMTNDEMYNLELALRKRRDEQKAGEKEKKEKLLHDLVEHACTVTDSFTELFESGLSELTLRYDSGDLEVRARTATGLTLHKKDVKYVAGKKKSPKK